MKMLLIGPPGSGKGTQSKFIIDKYNLLYISIGNILREISLKNNKLGKKIKYNLNNGYLIDDYIIISIIKNKLRNNNLENGFLIDGFPRNIKQALLMEKANINFDLVIEFYIQDSIIIDRLSNRLIHIPSGRIYHNYFNPPINIGLDDITGEPLSIRKDDNINVIKQRIESYNNNSLELKKYFVNKSINENKKYFLINSNINSNILRDVIFTILKNYSININ